VPRQHSSANANHFAKTSTKSNPGFEPDFQTDLNPGVWQISSKLLWIHSFVGVSHFGKYCEKRLVTWSGAITKWISWWALHLEWDRR